MVMNPVLCLEVGKIPRKLPVSWYNSSFTEEEIMLQSLRRAEEWSLSSDLYTLQQSATAQNWAERGILAMLQYVGEKDSGIE